MTSKQRKKKWARSIRQQVNDAKKKRIVKCEKCGQFFDNKYGILTARCGDFIAWKCLDCFRGKNTSGNEGQR